MSEAVKNILNILKAEGYLAPRDPSQDEYNLEEQRRKLAFWNATWKPVSRFLPGAFKEVFPDVQSIAQPPLTAAAAVQEPAPSTSEADPTPNLDPEDANTEGELTESNEPAV